MNSFLLNLLAFGAMLSAILVITAKNPVISVLFLISVFLNVSGYLVLMGVSYLPLVYIIVYVGAIAILFLFVVMMLNLRLVELLDTGNAYTQNLPFGTLLGSLFFFELLSITASSYKDTGLFQLPLTVFSKINSIFYSPESVEGVNAVSGQADVHLAYNPLVADVAFTNLLQIESIGQGLYTYGSLWVVVGSLILLLSMVGPILLNMNPRTNPQSA
uniref:NADH-ubiquinone oxidoreductase chain 6 n=1 Tax=Sterigmatomyces sp. TaxID=1972484 RepID=A0A7G7XQC5_9BASI|nr:NADH dehydrogenase subunit 6 [Sterigmatomyces sp.]